jgi:hypothetical protein
MAKLGKIFVGTALTVGITVLGAGAASAHNDAFTPIGCLTTANTNAGADVGFVKANDNAAPMNGQFGVIVLNASGKLPTGGAGQDNACK